MVLSNQGRPAREPSPPLQKRKRGHGTPLSLSSSYTVLLWVLEVAVVIDWASLTFVVFLHGLQAELIAWD